VVGVHEQRQAVAVYETDELPFGIERQDVRLLRHSAVEVVRTIERRDATALGRGFGAHSGQLACDAGRPSLNVPCRRTPQAVEASTFTAFGVRSWMRGPGAGSTPSRPPTSPATRWQ